MTAHTSGEWTLFYITLGLLACFGVVFKRTWDRPLQNGPDFFLGVKVNSGFYEGDGTRWLKGWHAVVLAMYSVTLLAALAIFASGWWYLFPAWAGGTAVLHVASQSGFTSYARAKLGANPPVLSSVAVPLQARHLGDYISWRVEALIGGIVVFNWILLLTYGGGRSFWEGPVEFTYVVIGLLPFEILIVRSSAPLPADRPAEHLRWIEAARRYSLRSMELFRWLFVVMLAGFGLDALLRTRHVPAVWVRWPVTGVFLAVGLYMAVFLIHGERRLAAMGRDLLPPGSWSTPFRRSTVMPPGYRKWFAVWFGGLILLLVFFRH